MLPHNQALVLISIYSQICDLYHTDLKHTVQRFSNNNQPSFTDQETITIFLFALLEEQKYTTKAIYNYADRYLRSWFPKLPTYTAFNNRINKLAPAFTKLSELLISRSMPDANPNAPLILDSMPIITCSGKRQAKVAKEITDKTYNATKGFWYNGLKLHALANQLPKQLPIPESIVITAASENDLNVFKDNWANIPDRAFFGDKIYFDNAFFDRLYDDNKSTMHTPVKQVKGTPDILKQRDKAADDLFSHAVSTIRQPIESFFNWINQKTQIQDASKVRSTKGLIAHVFGRLAAALFYLAFIYFNP